MKHRLEIYKDVGVLTLYKDGHFHSARGLSVWRALEVWFLLHLGQTIDEVMLEFSLHNATTFGKGSNGKV